MAERELIERGRDYLLCAKGSAPALLNVTYEDADVIFRRAAEFLLGEMIQELGGSQGAIFVRAFAASHGLSIEGEGER